MLRETAQFGDFVDDYIGFPVRAQRYDDRGIGLAQQGIEPVDLLLQCRPTLCNLFGL